MASVCPGCVLDAGPARFTPKHVSHPSPHSPQSYQVTYAHRLLVPLLPQACRWQPASGCPRTQSAIS